MHGILQTWSFSQCSSEWHQSLHSRLHLPTTTLWCNRVYFTLTSFFGPGTCDFQMSPLWPVSSSGCGNIWGRSWDSTRPGHPCWLHRAWRYTGLLKSSECLQGTEFLEDAKLASSLAISASYSSYGRSPNARNFSGFASQRLLAFDYILAQVDSCWHHNHRLMMI